MIKLDTMTPQPTPPTLPPTHTVTVNKNMSKFAVPVSKIQHEKV